MNDFVDLPPNGGSDGYDHKQKMRDLRAARKSIGISEPTVLMFTDEVDWWRGQMALSTAARLSSMVSRDPELISSVAEFHVKVRAKLVEAESLKRNADDSLRPLIEEYRQALLSQQMHSREGHEAMAETPINTTLVQKAYAMEYIASLRAKGYRHLIRYYMNGGNRPRILDDV